MQVTNQPPARPRLGRHAEADGTAAAWAIQEQAAAIAVRALVPLPPAPLPPETRVAFVIYGGRPVAEVARNIGVHEMTLGKWVRVARDAAESGKSPDAPLGESERAELARRSMQSEV